MYAAQIAAYYVPPPPKRIASYAYVKVFKTVTCFTKYDFTRVGLLFAKQVQKCGLETRLVQ